MLLKRLEGFGVALCTALLLSASATYAGFPEKRPEARTSSVTTNDHYVSFLINNVFNYYGNNGDGSFNKFRTDNEGFEFPKGSGKHLTFEDGVVWGAWRPKGFVDPNVGGSVYRHGLQAGPLVTYGTANSNPVAADPTDPAYRLFRVRADVNPNASFSQVEAKLNAEEVAYLTPSEPGTTAQSLYDAYVKDWNEWPAALGAPYTDVNGNGVYDPAVDTPGVRGADQTLWYVANDMNAPRVNNLAGCPPIGLEMQRTIWGYKRAGALGNTVFLSTLLVNKSGAPLDSMFLLQWADPDLGTYTDDLVGCDTTRNLGYVYNGVAFDTVYGTAVPAAGFAILQGPIVPSPGATANFRLHRRPGYRNLPMSAFVIFTPGPTIFADPRQGTGGNIDWYRLMNGMNASTGSPFIDPWTKQVTKFVFPGDPVKATDGSAGWVDGIPGRGLAPQDRRMCLVTGPFTMAPGDTQELVVANLAGVGSDRLSSISVFKTYVDQVQSIFSNITTAVGEALADRPAAFELAQNYPNPFNPATTIRYSIPRRSHLTLTVFNTLGQKIAELVNGDIDAGYHSVEFNANNLASGVYFYRIQAGSFTDVKKLMLIR